MKSIQPLSLQPVQRIKTLGFILLAILALAEKGYALSSKGYEVIKNANKLASSGRYEQAIEQYETLRSQNDWDEKLNKPLLSLYFNQAATEQQNGNWAKTQQWLEKGLKIGPEDPGLRRLQSLVWYQQAMEKAELYQSYGEAVALMEKAQRVSPSEKAIARGMASLYLRWAQEALIAQEYALAIKRAEAALGLDETAPEVKRSVAVIYLNAAQDAKDKAQQEQYIERAAAVDSSELTLTQIEQWKQRQSKLAAVGQSLKSANPFAETVEVPLHPFLLGDSKLDELPALKKLDLLEQQLVGEVSYGQAAKRIDALETQVYGQLNSSFPLSQRINKLYQELLDNGETTLGHSYINDVLAFTDGKVVRFQNFPLRIYLQEKPKPQDKKEQEALPEYWQLYKQTDTEALKEALNSWRQHTLGFVSFIYVDSPANADIQIVWKEKSTALAYSPELLKEDTDFFQTLKPIKPSKLSKVLKIASAFAPGPYSLIPQAGAAAADYAVYAKAMALKEKNTIELSFDSVKNLNDEQRKHYYYNALLREMAYRLGLKTKSKTPADISYPPYPLHNLKQSISVNDLATLRDLYRREADITLN